MCKHGNTVEMELPIVGNFRFGKADIDSCIAPIIKALNDAGLLTIGCCCGHGNRIGYIHFKDGRYLGVYPNRKSFMPHSQDKP